jgi:hypothetical protein
MTTMSGCITRAKMRANRASFKDDSSVLSAFISGNCNALAREIYQLPVTLQPAMILFGVKATRRALAHARIKLI